MTEPAHALPQRRPLDLRAAMLVVALCVVWGFQQVALKGVAANAAPVMQLAIRFAGASIFFGLWVLVSEGRRAFADGTLPSGLLLGLLFSLEFILAGQALVHTTAAHSVVFLYTAPIFTALGLQFLPEERLSPLQWAGIAVAFFGVVVAFTELGPEQRGAAPRPRRPRGGRENRVLSSRHSDAATGRLRRIDRADAGRVVLDDDPVVVVPDLDHRHIELPHMVLAAAPLSDFTPHAAVLAHAAIRRLVRCGAAWRSHRPAVRPRCDVAARRGSDRQLSAARAARVTRRLRESGRVPAAVRRGRSASRGAAYRPAIGRDDSSCLSLGRRRRRPPPQTRRD